MGSSCLCQQCPHAPSFTPFLLLEELPLFKAFARELILSDLMFISMTLGQTFPLVLYHFGCSSASSSYLTCFSFSIFFFNLWHERKRVYTYIGRPEMDIWYLSQSVSSLLLRWGVLSKLELAWLASKLQWVPVSIAPELRITMSRQGSELF